MENLHDRIDSGITNDPPRTEMDAKSDTSGLPEPATPPMTTVIAKCLTSWNPQIESTTSAIESTIWYSGPYESAKHESKGISVDWFIAVTDQHEHAPPAIQQEAVGVAVPASTTQLSTTSSVLQQVTTSIRIVTAIHTHTNIAILTENRNTSVHYNSTSRSAAYDDLNNSNEAPARHNDSKVIDLENSTITLVKELATPFGLSTAHKHATATGLTGNTNATLPDERYEPKVFLPLAITALAGVFIVGYIVAIIFVCFRHRRGPAQPTKARGEPESSHDAARHFISSEFWPNINAIANDENFVIGDSESDYGSHDDDKDLEPKSSRDTYRESIALQDMEGKPESRRNSIALQCLEGNLAVRRETWDELAGIEEYQLPSFGDLHQSRMSMRLSRSDTNNWLTLDRSYFDFHAARQQLLWQHPTQVIKYQESPRVNLACKELLEMVIEFLCIRRKAFFGADGARVYNRLIGEEFNISDGSNHPLELAARLAMEDFNILMMEDGGDEHKLVASATLFPAGWRLEERFGWTVTQLHNPVPAWGTILSTSVEK